MADNSILKALSQMENDLKEINSAREQVETIAKAYDALHGKVRMFTETTAQLSNNVKSLIEAMSGERTAELRRFEASLTSLEATSSAILSAFDSKCNDSMSRFGNKVIGFVDSVQTEISALHGEVVKLEHVEATIKESTQTINSLKSKTEILLDELKASQAAQDKMLEEVSASISVLQTSLQTAHGDLNKLHSEISDKFTEQKTILSQAKTDIQTDIQRTKSALHIDIEQLQDKILEQFVVSQGQLAKEIKMNRYLLAFAITIMLGVLMLLFI